MAPLNVGLRARGRTNGAWNTVNTILVFAGGQSIGVEWLVGNRGGRTTGRLCHGALSWPLPSDIRKARSVDMRNTVTAVLMGVMLVVAVGNISAQIAGSTTPGMSVEELTDPCILL